MADDEEGKTCAIVNDAEEETQTTEAEDDTTEDVDAEADEADPHDSDDNNLIHGRPRPILKARVPSIGRQSSISRIWSVGNADSDVGDISELQSAKYQLSQRRSLTDQTLHRPSIDGPQTGSSLLSRGVTEGDEDNDDDDDIAAAVDWEDEDEYARQRSKRDSSVYIPVHHGHAQLSRQESLNLLRSIRHDRHNGTNNKKGGFRHVNWSVDDAFKPARKSTKNHNHHHHHHHNHQKHESSSSSRRRSSIAAVFNIPSANHSQRRRSSANIVMNSLLHADDSDYSSSDSAMSLDSASSGEQSVETTKTDRTSLDSTKSGSTIVGVLARLKGGGSANTSRNNSVTSIGTSRPDTIIGTEDTMGAYRSEGSAAKDIHERVRNAIRKQIGRAKEWWKWRRNRRKIYIEAAAVAAGNDTTKPQSTARSSITSNRSSMHHEAWKSFRSLPGSSMAASASSPRNLFPSKNKSSTHPQRKSLQSIASSKKRRRKQRMIKEDTALIDSVLKSRLRQYGLKMRHVNKDEKHTYLESGWYILLMLVNTYTAFLLPFNVGFNQPVSSWNIVIDYCIDAIFLGEIAYRVWKHQAHKRFLREQNSNHDDTHSLFVYNWTEMVLDVLSNFPFELYFGLSAFQVHRLSSKRRFTRLLPLNRLLRVLKVFTKLVYRDVDLVSSSLRLTRMFLCLLVCMHWMGCMWHWIGAVEHANKIKSWITVAQPGEVDTVLSAYISSVYWVLQTVLKLGYGDIQVQAASEMVYYMFVNVFAAVLYASIMANVTLVLKQRQNKDVQYRRKIASVKRYLYNNKVPKDLRNRVYQYYDFLWSQHENFNFEDIVGELPVSMHSTISMYEHSTMFQESILFRFVRPQLQNEIADRLVLAVVPKDEMVLMEGFLGYKMFFIQSGGIEIWSEEHGSMTVLKPGTFFGEVAVLKRSVRTASARAIVNSVLYYLTSKQLMHIMQANPHFRKLLHSVADRRLAASEKFHDDDQDILTPVMQEYHDDESLFSQDM